MTAHKIEITVNGSDALPPNPLPPMEFGDTVQYFSKAGTVTIVFAGKSPFRADDAVMTAVTSNDTPTIKFNGSRTIFLCRCFVALPNGTTVGWRSDPSPSGGAHNVGH